MKIACTGFLSEQAGSIAAANALLLRTLLESGKRAVGQQLAPIAQDKFYACLRCALPLLVRSRANYGEGVLEKSSASLWAGTEPRSSTLIHLRIG